MPWTKFICPDQVEIPITECLEKCRMDQGRCVALPTLQMFAKGRREWKGVLSTTAGLNGSRLEYLKITREYAEAPCSRAFALLGTFHHLRFQKMDLPDTLSEVWLEDEIGSGMFDYYDAQERTIYDFKTCGAWKICKVLGKRKVEEPIPGEYFKSGPRKGEQKTKKVWEMCPPDTFDWAMQGSRYSWMLIDIGFPVDKYIVQATVRDFTRQTSRQYGLERQIYLIEIPILRRDQVVEFYALKSLRLKEALESGVMPEPCSPTERWDDRRCIGYCPVVKFCDYGMEVKQKHQEDANDEIA